MKRLMNIANKVHYPAQINRLLLASGTTCFFNALR